MKHSEKYLRAMILYLVKLGLWIFPVDGFSQLRDTLKYAEARVKDNTIHTDLVLRILSEKAMGAIGALVKSHLEPPVDTPKKTKVK